MNKPLTNEQIWGVPDEQLPEPEVKDFFDTEATDLSASREAESTED